MGSSQLADNDSDTIDDDNDSYYASDNDSDTLDDDNDSYYASDNDNKNDTNDNDINSNQGRHYSLSLPDQARKLHSISRMLVYFLLTVDLSSRM